MKLSLIPNQGEKALVTQGLRVSFQIVDGIPSTTFARSFRPLELWTLVYVRASLSGLLICT
jgi:hypothetical protein